MKKGLRITALLLGGLFMFVVGMMVMGKMSPIGLGLHSEVMTEDGFALGRYDVTTYFNEPLQKGKEEFSYEFKGQKWLFISEENLILFKSNAEKFVPQFGGYCTKAVGAGIAAPSDPTCFTVYNEKLYIFSAEEIKKEFLADPNGVAAACEANWE